VEATKAAGVNTNLYLLLIFLLSAAFVGLATAERPL
jgi:ABC-type branched-subunit amino acid transport system permease subunit